MTDPIELRLVTSNSFPSGTGSYDYRGEFQIVVQNIDYTKQVSIQARSDFSTNWQDYPASYVESVPENREIWHLTTGVQLIEFVATYTVRDVTYWDNNGGSNYHQPVVADEFDALLGRVPQIVLGGASFSDATHIRVRLAVRNLAYDKVVGIVFTTNNWATTQTTYGYYSWTMRSGIEVWAVDTTVGTADQVEFAVFYQVQGQEYWDNNFWRNYTLRRTTSLSALKAPIAAWGSFL
jgi:hypothetical protein